MKVLDLFSGIGGFSIGFEKAGFETVAFCEFDENARKVLRKNWPNTPIYNDVKELNYEQLRKDGISVDIICGGFPCQDISLAGKGAGLEGERSGLWFEFHRLIEEIKPKYAVIENVSALRSRGLDQVLRSLHEIGYDAEWHCIPASAVGAPHRRDRVWIMAYRNSDDWRDECSTISSERKTRLESRCSSQRQHQPITEQELAYANDSRSGTPKHDIDGNWSQIEQGRQEQSLSRISRCREDVAYTIEQGSQGRLHWWTHQKWQGQLGHLGRCCSTHGQPIESQWTVEPNVGRVANGVPNRTHRLKQLGNAVVPQIPELLAMAIIDYERSK